MITVKTQLNPENGECESRIGIFGEHKHIVKEYSATIEGIARAILEDTPEHLHPLVKVDILRALMKTFDIVK